MEIFVCFFDFVAENHVKKIYHLEYKIFKNITFTKIWQVQDVFQK